MMNSPAWCPRLKTALCIAMAALLAACATTGKEITPNQLTGFRKGETTLAEVTAKLGRPTSTTLLSSGGRTISYIFAHAQVRPATLIPIVGPLLGGSDSRSSLVYLTFDKDGKLQDYSASQSQFGTGVGLSGGRYQSQTPDQPMEADSVQ